MDCKDVAHLLDAIANKLVWRLFEDEIRRDGLATFLYRKVAYQAGNDDLVCQQFYSCGRFDTNYWPNEWFRVGAEFASAGEAELSCRDYLALERRLIRRLDALVRLFVRQVIRDVVFGRCGLLATLEEDPPPVCDPAHKATQIQCQPRASSFLHHLAKIGRNWYQAGGCRLVAIVSRSAMKLLKEHPDLGWGIGASGGFYGIDLLLGPPGMPQNSIIVLPRDNLKIFACRQEGGFMLSASVALDLDKQKWVCGIRADGAWFLNPPGSLWFLSAERTK